MVVILKQQLKSSLNVHEAIDNLSTLLDLEVDVRTPIGVYDENRFILKEDKLTTTNVVWLYPDNYKEIILHIKNTYLSLFEYLKGIYDSEFTDWSDIRTKKGLQAILVMAGEVVHNMDNYFALAENAEKIKELRNRWLLDTIVIDAGHGGKDPGAIGSNGIQEKTITLDVARQLGRMIEKNIGAKVIYTRDEDVFVTLKNRTKIANESNGKMFVSIHVNTTPNNRNAKGFETYLLRPGRTDDAIRVAQRENGVIALEESSNEYNELSDENIIIATMAQSTFMKESETLAQLIQEELDKTINAPNRGVKQAGFHVLVGASMPNVLVEIGFLSNKQERKLLGKASYRKKIAKSIYAAIVRFKDKYESSIIDAN